MQFTKSLLAAGLCTLPVLAFTQDSAMFDPDDETLSIPSASVQGQPGRFQDVVLVPAGSGLWRVAQVHDGVLLDARYVEQVWTTATSGVPQQFFIHLAGTFPNGCPQIGRVEQQLQGNSLQVYIYYHNNAWLRDPESVACTQAMVPFELTIALQIYGLAAGEYAVLVNDYALRSLVLEQDNIGPKEFGAGRRAHCQYEPRQQAGWTAYECTDSTELILQ
jgi:hypothetical protein